MGSVSFEDAIADHVIAELVDCNHEVIVVSHEQLQVDFEVEIAHVHHVLKVLLELLILASHVFKLFHVGKL